MATILLAEDDTPMRGFLKLALEKAGHEVTDRADGIAALDTLRTQGPFDLLLADIVMPGLDGIALSQEAAKIAPGMKVMFITGFAAVAMNHPQMENGVAPVATAPVMSKPFHLKDLVAQVEQLLATETTTPIPEQPEQ